MDQIEFIPFFPINMRTIAQRTLTFLLIAFPVWSTGCANLSAIQEFASISAGSADYARLVDQYVETPARQKKYQPEGQHARLDEMTRVRAVQKERLLLRQKLVVQYMSALGQLAADEVVDYDSQMEGLEHAVVENKFAEERDAEAFASVSKALLRASTDAWRKRRLQELIAESNAPFQTVVGTLKDIVDKEFAGDIENEKLAMTGYYETLIRSSSDRAGIAALEEWKTVRLAEADARVKADSCYAQVLSTIAAGHQSLFDKRDDLGAQELVRQLKTYTNDIRSLVSSIRGQ